MQLMWKKDPIVSNRRLGIDESVFLHSVVVVIGYINVVGVAGSTPFMDHGEYRLY